MKLLKNFGKSLYSFLVILFAEFIIFNVPIVFAQNAGLQKISSVIVDESNNPVIGAAIVENKNNGTITDIEGKFTLIVDVSCTQVTIEAMGFKKKVMKLPLPKKIFLESYSEILQETVVTGIFTRKKDSFTGAVQAISSDELKRSSNTNVIESLKNIDPSLLIIENLSEGSNPNAIASMQIRGASTLSNETSSLKSGFLNKANMPLFILDGFETSVQKIQDMDMNRVQSITILKDASAKAIYGSKGANGVIVIETKALLNEKSRINYTGSLVIEAPDLTSYNLCNALEKLDIENRENYYSGYKSLDQTIYHRLYAQRLKRALEGESTYWLSKPLRIAFGNKHSLGVELGSKEIKALVSFGYNDTQGTMKGSYRNVITGDVNLSYRRGKWIFRNIMSISSMNSEDSPWGSFSEYASINPYFTPYDEDGHLKKILYNASNIGTTEDPATFTTTVTNPMYNAHIGTKYSSKYLNFSNNFYAEYQLQRYVKIVSRFGVDTQRSESEVFKPADHTDYATRTEENALLLRGLYNITNGEYTTYSGDISSQFNYQFGDLHDIFATAQYNVSETKYKEITHYTEGYPNSNMKSIIFARQYANDATPTGGEGLNRNLGALITTGYSYANRYMMDATLKASASSVFGTDRKWGTFWSLGLAWNIHNESFIKDNINLVKQMKIRISAGSSGNQNYSTNVSLPIYQYFSSNYYNGFSGAYLKNMENRGLGWEQKLDYNIGMDFRTKRITAVIDAYIADTQNMVFSRSLLPSTGYTSVSDNIGLVRNKGIEASLSYILYQSGSSYVSIFGRIASNDNRVQKISDAMREFNNIQKANAKSSGSTAPVTQYYDGVPLRSIWVVPSLGIDPVTGNEIYIDRNGTPTNIWSASNLVNYGSSDPLFNGNFGINGEIKGFGFNFVCTYYGGGYLYNTTLLDKVEGTSLEKNVDRRIFAGRWFKKGQEAKYKASVSGQTSLTLPTSRFVQRNNVLTISSASLYYEFPLKIIKKLGLERLRATIYANDLYTFSSIEIERGTYYPYARKFSLALTTTF